MPLGPYERKQIKAMHEEITTLRQQLEKAEARAAKQTDALQSIAVAMKDAGTLSKEMHDLIVAATDGCTEAFILRKQAEAVEKCEVELNQTPGAMLWDMDQVQSWLAEEVHRLRNQADELEKAGGEP